MARSLFTFLLLLTVAQGASFGQTSSERLQFQDTLLFSRLPQKDLPGVEEGTQFLDTIHDPECYVIRTSSSPNRFTVSLAFKKEGAWKLYQLFDNMPGEIRVEQADFNEKGAQELVIRYSRSNGMSSRTHGWAEYEKGFVLVDPDSFLCLAHLIHYSSHMDWFQNMEPAPDTMALEKVKLTGHAGDRYGSNYFVSVSKGRIRLTESNHCDDFGENIKKELAQPEIITYVSDKDKLVRKDQLPQKKQPDLPER